MMGLSLLSRRICARRLLPLSRALTTSPSESKILPFAFALDIDGVLLNGPNPHPRAKEALTKLQDSSIPFVLLTNGGGHSEAARSEDLSSRLDFPINSSQIIQSHTPLKLYVKHYETVLVVGGEGENCRKVAEDYGFKNVFIPDDFHATYPAISPFSPYPPASYARQVPEGTKIDAIFVFNDPRDWALSLQVMIDTLQSDNGIVGTVAKPGSGGCIPTFFTSTDLVWANEYHIPRLGQGAFKAAVVAVNKRLPNRVKLKLWRLGKPSNETYRYAQDLLLDSVEQKQQEMAQEGEALGADSVMGENQEIAPEGEVLGMVENTPAAKETIQRKKNLLQRVYMVGDNPVSDIKGANSFKDSGHFSWWSILVRSGVWREGQTDCSPIAIVDDVLAAVDWALENERKISAGELLARRPHPKKSKPKRTKPKRAKKDQVKAAPAEESKTLLASEESRKPLSSEELNKSEARKEDGSSSSDSD